MPPCEGWVGRQVIVSGRSRKETKRRRLIRTPLRESATKSNTCEPRTQKPLDTSRSMVKQLLYAIATHSTQEASQETSSSNQQPCSPSKVCHRRDLTSSWPLHLAPLFHTTHTRTQGYGCCCQCNHRRTHVAQCTVNCEHATGRRPLVTVQNASDRPGRSLGLRPPPCEDHTHHRHKQATDTNKPWKRVNNRVDTVLHSLTSNERIRLVRLLVVSKEAIKLRLTPFTYLGDRSACTSEVVLSSGLWEVDMKPSTLRQTNLDSKVSGQHQSMGYPIPN